MRISRSSTPRASRAMIEEAVKLYPNFQVVCHDAARGQVRQLQRLGRDRLEGRQIRRGGPPPNLEIFDRVGGGDSFASGLIYGLMTTGDVDYAVNCGAAHGALAMTTPGRHFYGDLRRGSETHERRRRPRRPVKSASETRPPVGRKQRPSGGFSLLPVRLRRRKRLIEQVSADSFSKGRAHETLVVRFSPAGDTLSGRAAADHARQPGFAAGRSDCVSAPSGR